MKPVIQIRASVKPTTLFKSARTGLRVATRRLRNAIFDVSKTTVCALYWFLVFKCSKIKKKLRLQIDIRENTFFNQTESTQQRRIQSAKMELFSIWRTLKKQTRMIFWSKINILFVSDTRMCFFSVMEITSTRITSTENIDKIKIDKNNFDINNFDKVCFWFSISYKAIAGIWGNWVI